MAKKVSIVFDKVDGDKITVDVSKITKVIKHDTNTSVIIVDGSVSAIVAGKVLDVKRDIGRGLSIESNGEVSAMPKTNRKKSSKTSTAPKRPKKTSKVLEDSEAEDEVPKPRKTSGSHSKRPKRSTSSVDDTKPDLDASVSHSDSKDVATDG